MSKKQFFCVLLAATCFVFSGVMINTVRAETAPLEVTDAQAIDQGLKSLIGKGVTLRLRGGEEMSGVLEAVGPTAVRLGQLTGKEFFSAIIRIEEIAGVVYRAK